MFFFKKKKWVKSDKFMCTTEERSNFKYRLWGVGTDLRRKHEIRVELGCS